MKATIIAAVAAIALVGAVVPVIAQEEPAPQPNAVGELRQQFLEERAEMLSKILEKHAEVVRLSTAKEPDVEKIQALVKEIAGLRDEQQKRCAEYKATVAALGQPAFVPPAGVRAGRLGVGPGAAQRPQWGRGWGGYPCPWQGYAPSLGRAGRPGPGAAWGGLGLGRGRGPGPGRGFGRGQGGFGGPGMGVPGAPGARPWGPGRGFVDTDNDGVCDYWQGFGPGRGHGSYGAPGAGMPSRPGARMRGLGRGFVDNDNDGVCDYWQDLGNPPRAPIGPPPAEDEQPAPPSEG